MAATAIQEAARILRPVVAEFERRLNLIRRRLPMLRDRLTTDSMWRLADGVIVPLHGFVSRYRRMLAAMRVPGSRVRLDVEGAAMKGRASLLWLGFELFAAELEAGGVTW